MNIDDRERLSSLEHKIDSIIEKLDKWEPVIDSYNQRILLQENLNQRFTSQEKRLDDFEAHVNRMVVATGVISFIAGFLTHFLIV